MMKLLKQLLSIYLFIAVKTATDNDFNNDYNTYTKIRHHSNRGIIDTMRYDVQLIPLINVEDFYDRNIYGRFVSYINDQLEKNFIYYGESTIFFKVKIKTNSIRLNALNMEIEEDATQVIFSSDGINDIIYTPIMQLHDIESETIILYFIDNFVPSYSYRLIIKFVSIITNNTAGFFQMSYINETGGNVNMIAVIDLRVPGAHLAFPCWDQSDFKTNFTISIKFNENYIALSNIPNVEKITDDDIVFTYFNSTDNTSPYIIAFILSDLERVSDENFEQRFIDMWCRPNVVEQLEYALNIAKNISLANLNYDFFAVHSLLDLIVIPDFQDNIMESFRLYFL
ncbi:endoplasmic reticulum aminopeptidase 1-like [Pogonomyrmex barbatus]|uniref:Endoplasmic reticulum aminopeptidase 1-like n=1 Tax=Pogonomyrmex barbatus TaxID=144034 RepID=A0A6I9W6B2_9HYME|nr:endoplasmic reticulum aminopeptidase 1-like [Pogonomyrmex barbatus]